MIKQGLPVIEPLFSRSQSVTSRQLRFTLVLKLTEAYEVGHTSII